MAAGLNVELVTYREEFAPAFAELNYQWIEHYFEIEAEDRAALDHPETYALAPGGEIFFVLENGAPVGTVAMVPKDPARQVFELAKMAVLPERQGRGYSKLLMQACINYAHSQGAAEIMLVTNDVLGPALGLYQQAGFVAQPHNSDQRYARGNLEMRLALRAGADAEV